MTEPTSPEWVLWVGGALGTALAAFIARMGFKAGEPSKTAAKTDAVITAVGGGWGSHEQMERLVEAAQDIASAIRDEKEVARNKRQEQMQETLEDVLEQLKGREGR